MSSMPKTNTASDTETDTETRTSAKATTDTATATATDTTTVKDRTTPILSPDELVGRLAESFAGAVDLFALYAGEQLGLYRALHEQGPATSRDVATRTGMHERYAREWLEHQTIAGLLIVDGVSQPAGERVYSLPSGYENVLVDPDSPMFSTPMGRLLIAAMRQAPSLLTAYRTGAGVSWAAYGDDMRTGQSDLNRPLFLHNLVPDYLSQIEGLDDALRRPRARIAEIGPGGGWAAVAMAGAYPDAIYEGFEVDGPSVDLANANLAEAGLADRARVFQQDAARAKSQGQCDLVIALECIHDLADPIRALAAMRKLAKPGGRVIVMDERCAEEFGAVGDIVERVLYGYSLMVCLPDGMSQQPSAGTGTVMRPSTMDAYARKAGFARADVLALENDMFRFYDLVIAS